MLLLELGIGVYKYSLWHLISRSWKILLSRNGLPGRQIRISDQVLAGKGLRTKNKKSPGHNGDYGRSWDFGQLGNNRSLLPKHCFTLCQT